MRACVRACVCVCGGGGGGLEASCFCEPHGTHGSARDITPSDPRCAIGPSRAMVSLLRPVFLMHFKGRKSTLLL